MQFSTKRAIVQLVQARLHALVVVTTQPPLRRLRIALPVKRFSPCEVTAGAESTREPLGRGRPSQGSVCLSSNWWCSASWCQISAKMGHAFSDKAEEALDPSASSGHAALAFGVVGGGVNAPDAQLGTHGVDMARAVDGPLIHVDGQGATVA